MLFDEAYQIIKKAHDADPEGVPMNENVLKNGRIASLEEYFAHIGYLADYHSNNLNTEMASNATYQKSAKFLMLPMDEKHDVNAGCFYIDLNSRNIQVPTVYSKYGVSVTGDQMAETLMFKVPRYFDYTDLTSTEIYVQWTNPAGEEGASRIVLVDYESEEGYILFGWPLTSNVTKESPNNAPLKFSVRFFVRDADKNIKYSLNTLTASVMIKQALYTNFNNNLKIDDPSILFGEAILNGVDTNMTLPKVPMFFSEWNLPAKDSLENDTLELVTQGGAPDAGLVFYKWYYYPRFVEDNVVVDKKDDYQSKEYSANTNVPVEKPSNVLVPEDGRTYYVSDGQGGYVIFDGDTFEDNVTYYEMVNIYTIYNKDIAVEDVMEPSQKYWPHVAGDYKVTLLNRIGTAEAPSNATLTCTIPCIEYVKFTTDLKNNEVLNTIGEGDDAIDQAILTVSVEVNDDAEKSYEWYKKDSSDGEYVAITGATNSNVTVNTPGYYKAKVTGTLNREQMWNDSNECKVTYPAKAPEIKKYFIDDNEYTFNLDGVIETVPGLNKPTTFRIEIEELDEFKTDEVTYTWYRNTPNSNAKEVSVSDADIESINGNEITVKLLHNSALPVDIAFYYCEIANTLAGKTETTISEVFQIS